MVQNNKLKVLEEDNIDFIVVYPAYVDGFDEILYKKFYVTASKINSRRYTLHVFTEKEPPYYLEDFIKILQNNILYTIVIRYHGFSLEKYLELLNSLDRDDRRPVILIHSDLEEYMEKTREKGFEYIVVGGGGE